MKGFEQMKIWSAVKMVKQPIVEQLEKRIEVLERDCLKLRQEANMSRHEKEKYRQIVEHAPTGIYEFDLQRLKFTRVNDIMCKVTGYSREEFLSICLGHTRSPGRCLGLGHSNQKLYPFYA